MAGTREVYPKNQKLSLLLAPILALALVSPAQGEEEPGFLVFEREDFEVLEGSGAALIKVRRVEGVEGEVSVHVATSDGSAKSGQDYTSHSDRLVWASGEDGLKTFEVSIVDDEEAEDPEFLNLQLSEPLGGALLHPERSAAVLEIFDDDEGEEGHTGVLGFLGGRFEVDEHNGAARITVMRREGEDGAVSVEFQTGDATALAGEDYTGVVTTVAWASGEGGEKSVLVPILDDDAPEDLESLHLVLREPTGGAVLHPELANAVLVIEDDEEPGVLRFQDERFDVNEAEGTLRIKVLREEGVDGEVTVQFHTGDASAVAGEDYTAVSATLTWASGEGGEKSVLVPILDDDRVEDQEFLHLGLDAPQGGAVLHPELDIAALVIHDDDGQREGEAGVLRFLKERFEVDEDAGSARITVLRREGEAGEVSVQFQTTDGSATAGEDYAAVLVNLSWASGEGGEKSVEVPILDDDDVEDPELLHLELLEPTGGATLHPELAAAVLVIEDDDEREPTVVGFDQREFVSREEVGVVVLTVERSGRTDQEVTVSYSTVDGSATAPEDYEAGEGTLVWGPGDEGIRSFRVPIVDDDRAEKKETFEVLLTHPTGDAVLDPHHSSAVVTIDDDDEDDEGDPGKVRFRRLEFTAAEGGDVAVIEVERIGGTQGVVGVDYATEDGSATSGVDYTPASGTFTWGSGDDGVRSFNVPVLDDDTAEGNESVHLVLDNPTGGVELAQGGDGGASSVLTVLDDDSAKGDCEADDETLCLLGGRFQAEVVWRAANGDAGSGTAMPISDTTGLYWFFDAANIEMLLKVLDACEPFGHYWVFLSAATNVDFTVTVTDTVSGLSRQYTNPLNQAALPVQDTLTFNTCP